MSKKADNIMSDKDDSDELPLEPEPPPGRVSSADVPPGTPGPRAARFGEGVEGQGARRERAVAGPRTGPIQRTGNFLHDVREEMKRVSWPSAKEVQNTTIITIIAVIFFAVYLFGVDLLIVQIGRFAAWLLSLVGLAA